MQDSGDGQGGIRRGAGLFAGIFSFKMRTKLLTIFLLMFAGIFYVSSIIIDQSKINNVFTERQAKIMVNQTTLSDAISCFGAIKYWFAILDNGLKKNPVELPAAAEKGVICDLDQFGDRLRNLSAFSKKAEGVEENYSKIRDLPKNAMMAYIENDPLRGEKEMEKAYDLIATIDDGLKGITEDLNKESGEIVALAYQRSEEFKKFPIFFLAFGMLAILLISLMIFFNIFRPIENITSTMIDASKDPHNTKNYIVDNENRHDEVGEAISALNILLLQVHEGFRRTKEAEQEIAKAAQRLDAIFNSVADGLITVNAEGEIESINKSAYRIFSGDEKTICGKKIADFFPPQTGIKYVKGIYDFMNSGDGDLVGAGPREMTGLKCGGGEFPIELSVTNIPLDDGATIFVNVIRDITDRKELERQLLQAQKMEALGSLSSGIAHEINTPTQYVRDNIKFLKDAFAAYDGFYKDVVELKEGASGEGTPFRAAIEEKEAARDISFFQEEAPLAIEQSLEGTERISEIVSAVKGFSYPATDEQIFVDLNEALKNTVVVSRNQWKNFAHLETDFDANLPPVPCIPGKLTQVILNLIVNAAHAIEEKCGGQGDPDNNAIGLSTALSGKNVVIKVSDTGCGIPPENMTKIFDAFFTTKEVGKGTGQGLSISYDIIVKKHKGTLNVASEVGKGTTFTIELPMESAEAKQGKTAAKSRPA